MMRIVELEDALLRGLRGRRVLVTGYTGFKGGWLCLWLKTLGAKVWGYALEPPTEPSFFETAGIRDCLDRAQVADVRDLGCLFQSFEDFQPEVVFHLAAQSLVRWSYQEPKLTFDTNVGGTVNLLECVRKSPSVRALVNVTSDKCYENREWVWGYREIDAMGGQDPYSASKGAAELVSAAYLQSYFRSRPRLGAATARAGNVLGGGDWARDRIIPDAVRALSQGKPVPVRNPRAVRPWQHVLEPLSGYLLLAASLLEAPEDFSGAWNFGPSAGKARSVLDVVETFLSSWGSGGWRDMGEDQRNAPNEAARLQLCCDKAIAHLAWLPRWGFDRTVRETARWYREHVDGQDVRRLSEAQIREYLSDWQR
jgi:CDP-glucose 4,6-dehydratase